MGLQQKTAASGTKPGKVRKRSVAPSNCNVLLMPETCTVKIQERRPTLQPGEAAKPGVMVLRGKPEETDDTEMTKRNPGNLDSQGVTFDLKPTLTPMKHMHGESTPTDSKESLNARFARQTQEMLKKMPVNMQLDSNELYTIPQSTSRDRVKI